MVKILIKKGHNAQKRHLLQLRNEVGDSLRALSSGATLDEFCSTLASLSAEQLELELEELGEKESELDSERNKHSQRIGELNQMLQQMDGSDRAAEAAEKAAQLMTEGVDLVGQLMRLELAEHILKIEMERYRQANEGPILKRSSQEIQIAELGKPGFHRHPQYRSGFDTVDTQVVGDGVEFGALMRCAEPAVGAHQANGLVLQRGDQFEQLIDHSAVDIIGMLQILPGFEMGQVRTIEQDERQLQVHLV